MPETRMSADGVEEKRKYLRAIEAAFTAVLSFIDPTL
jgi:hypothetical protein